MTDIASPPARISLVLSDVDGTLVTPKKLVTERTIAAARKLKAAGVAFAVTSSRPPAGLAKVVAALGIETPVAGFNGGMIVDRSGATIRKLPLPRDAAARTVAMLTERNIDIWVFVGNDWLLTNPDGEYVAHEKMTLSYGPTIVPDFAPHLDGVTKIVASGSDPDKLREAEAALQQSLAGDAAASMSQTYYVDVTNLNAHKGAAVTSLSEILLIPPAEIATIGDGENDVPMFEASGYSVAMGNASSKVQARANAVTGSNTEEGWADAIERYILPLAPKPAG